MYNVFMASGFSLQESKLISGQLVKVTAEGYEFPARVIQGLDKSSLLIATKFNINKDYLFNALLNNIGLFQLTKIDPTLYMYRIEEIFISNEELEKRLKELETSKTIEEIKVSTAVEDPIEEIKPEDPIEEIKPEDPIEEIKLEDPVEEIKLENPVEEIKSEEKVEIKTKTTNRKNKKAE